ncbi:FG-GAP repeat protein [Leptospira sp. 201903071]|uniref:FG-GAP-like repeat-containing protein n=1 Tax=Leptospira ainazelensis TaxID=2810034 RepID=UPI001963BE4E|nr:FG-GAP-like repeat-containing protein [Leptospira ainazelensis]MBM9499613.1 FG-GAP repeat protein [Leptospira ainazelensis]
MRFGVLFIFINVFFLSSCALKSMENLCDASSSLFYKQLIVSYFVNGGDANSCGVSFGVAQPRLLSVGPRGLLNSGFISGDFDSSITGVEVSLDSGSFINAQISGNQWKFQLPAAAVPSTIPQSGIWKEWSLHSITIRSVTSSGRRSVPFTVTLQKGLNKDINGDGYPDALIGSQNSARARAYLSLGQERGLDGTSITTINGAAGFGYSVVLSDIDGDGYADATISNTTANFAVYLSLGAVGGLSSTALTPTTVGTGILNLAAGDINADGFSDIIVGSPYDAGNNGTVYFFTSNAALGQGVSYVQQMNNPGLAGSTQFYGYSIALGDINGDQKSDVLIGAVGSGQNGALFVHLSQGTLLAAQSQVFTGSVANTWFANSAATADVNRDGLADLVLGAYQESASAGRTYLYLSNSGLLTTVTNSPVIGFLGSQSGTSVASGDINGDGFLDILTGGYSYTSAFPAQGCAQTFLFDGNLFGLASIYLNFLTQDINQGNMGNVISAGDINGDGFTDFLVGAPNSIGGGAFVGKAYLYLSAGASGYTSAPQIFSDPDATGAFGSSVDL